MCVKCDAFSMSRRTVFRGAAGLTLGAAMAGCASASTGQLAQAPPDRSYETPEMALQALVQGNARYVANQPLEKDFSATRASRSKGQAPFAAILSCADSRVAPEYAFDRGPGELFVVRVAGNFVTDEGLGSLEFGAAVLGTKVIMVLGHTSCGAVNATVDALRQGNNLPGHIAGLVRAMKPGIEPVLKQPGADIYQRAVVANVQANVKRLSTATPILAGMVAGGKLGVVGGVYELETGRVTLV